MKKKLLAFGGLVLLLVAVLLIKKKEGCDPEDDFTFEYLTVLQKDDLSIVKYKKLYENKQNVAVYVGTNGDDQNDGTVNSPLASVEKARDVIRIIKKKMNPGYKKNYSIIFLNGTYFFEDTFVLDSNDRGTVSSPILLMGEEKGKVIFYGGKKVDNKFFKKALPTMPGWNMLDESIREHVVMIDLKELGYNDYGAIQCGGYEKAQVSPMELFINGQAMELARWPNNSYALVGEVIDSSLFLFEREDLSKWAQEKDLWAKGFWKYGWADFNLPINLAKSDRNSIILRQLPPSKFGVTEGAQWFVFNALSELDAAGEYYIDRTSGWLYFIAPNGFSVSDLNVSLSVFGDKSSAFLRIVNTSNICIKNISFTETRYSGIDVLNSSNITIEDCSISNVGAYAIYLKGENSECKLNHLKIFNVGAFGIKMEGGNRNKLLKGNNIVSNCTIYNLGRINYCCSSYGVSLSGVGNIVSNCEIYNSPHTAIMFDGNYHTINKNKIHDVCLETDDAGAIYCGRDWALGGNVIINNFIYNITGSGSVKHKNRHGIHGVYLDDCASGITVFGNMFYNIKNIAVLNNGGRDNKVDNNIFYKCMLAHKAHRKRAALIHQDELYRKLEEVNYKTPPFCDSFPQLLSMSRYSTQIIEYLNIERLALKYPRFFSILNIQFDSDYDPVGCTFRNNVIYKNKIEKWLKKEKYMHRKKLQDALYFYEISNNLLGIDPLFVDEEGMDFNVSDCSPIYKISQFQLIPFDQIGVLN